MTQSLFGLPAHYRLFPLLVGFTEPAVRRVRSNIGDLARSETFNRSLMQTGVQPLARATATGVHVSTAVAPGKS